METYDAIDRLIAAATGAKATRIRLREAVEKVAALILDKCKEAGLRDLPRGWSIRIITSNIGGEARYLALEGDDEGAEVVIGRACNGGYLDGDFSAPMPMQTDDGLREFASQISDGLLDQISEQIERQTSSDVLKVGKCLSHLKP